jgi:hypothetical protein
MTEYMPIPPFDASGFLPAGIHECTALEIEATFCTNDTRKAIWAGFNGFLSWIQNQPQPSAILVDGSFTTDKAIPSDVDVVIEVSTLNLADQNTWIKFWSVSHKWAKNQFSTDFYPVVTNGSDFSAYFQYVKIEDALDKGLPLGGRKGILRVTL